MVRAGRRLVGEYLEFLEGRCRPNTVLAAAYDLRVFFDVVAKPAEDIRATDVLGFITAQRTGRSSTEPLQPVDMTTPRLGCRPARWRAGCRSSRGSSPTCRHAATSVRTRCPAVCRAGASVRVRARGCR